MLEPERIRELWARRDPRTPGLLRQTLNELPSHTRDTWLDALFGLDAIMADDAGLPRGCVPYYPSSVEVILRAIDSARVTARDRFVDIGCGVGRVALLTHLLTGARTLGLEIQPALVDRARAIAHAFQASSCEFIEGDAAELLDEIGMGTVFFLYCPFSDARLERVIERIGEIAAQHPLRLCCVHLPVIRRPWLALVSPENAELLVYEAKR